MVGILHLPPGSYLHKNTLCPGNLYRRSAVHHLFSHDALPALELPSWRIGGAWRRFLPANESQSRLITKITSSDDIVVPSHPKAFSFASVSITRREYIEENTDSSSSGPDAVIFGRISPG